MALAGAAVLVPFLLGVLSASDEAEGSAAYRGSLLSLVPYFRLFGVSDALEISVTGRAYFAGFRSIDSQLVLFGLSYGWITLGFVVLLLAWLCSRRCAAGLRPPPSRSWPRSPLSRRSP